MQVSYNWECARISVMQAGSFLPRKLQISDHRRDVELGEEVMPKFVTMFLEGNNQAQMFGREKFR